MNPNEKYEQQSTLLDNAGKTRETIYQNSRRSETSRFRHPLLQ